MRQPSEPRQSILSAGSDRTLRPANDIPTEGRLELAYDWLRSSGELLPWLRRLAGDLFVLAVIGTAVWILLVPVPSPLRSTPNEIETSVQVYPITINDGGQVASGTIETADNPTLTGAALEVLPSPPPVPVIATPSNADPPPSLPIRAQEVLALPPDLSSAPAEDLAPDLARSTAVPIRSPRTAPVLPAPEASKSEVPSAISTSPAEAPDSVLDLSEIELAQPVEGTPGPAAVAAEPARPESIRDFAVAEPVTSAPTIPETAEATIAGAELPRLPLRPRVVLPAASQIAPAEPSAPSIRPGFRDEAPVTLRSEARVIAQPVRTEAPQCNIEACAAAYRSFRASDCTYQPFEGPRQLCTR